MLKQASLKYKAFPPIGLTSRTWPDAVLAQAPVWLSTDLRDGNQALIEPMDLERKLRMFQMLVDIGFKEIEVGFPSASQIEFDFVRRLIDGELIPQDVAIQVLTHAREPLIDRTFEAVRGAPRVIMHMVNPVAPVMREVVLGLSEDGVVALVQHHARLFNTLARQQPATEWTFEYSPEMFSGTELAFSKRVVDAVTDVWQASPQRKCIVNLPTTVEHSTPNVFADMIEWMHRHIERRDGVILSVHPHNDRGTGTAAAELALMAGAERVEGCLFGNGERTGNLDLVNVALNLYTQGVDPGLDFSDIDEIRRTVEHCNQIAVHPRHPYAGDLVYTSFSGSHQDAIKKVFAARKNDERWDVPYLPIDPKDLGRSYEAVIRVNSQSGKAGIAYLLEATYGVVMPRRLQIEFARVAQLSMDRHGKELSAHDLWRALKVEFELEGIVKPLHTSTAMDGGGMYLAAEVVLNGDNIRFEGQGRDTVAAFADGLGAAMSCCIRVFDCHVQSIGGVSGAKNMACIEMQVDDQHTLFGVGVDADAESASLKAILSGWHRAQIRRPVSTEMALA